MTLVTLIGLAAAIVTTSANVPQVWKAWRTRDAEDLSLKMTLLLTAGLGLWVIYGILQTDIVIIVANAVAMALAISLTVLKLKFG